MINKINIKLRNANFLFVIFSIVLQIKNSKKKKKELIIERKNLFDQK